MSRDVPDVVVFALVVVVTVSMVALPASALGGATATATATTADGDVAPQTTNGSDGSANESESLAPGQRLAGVVGVQGAEIDGEIEERTLATRVDRAESNASKAAVVATELNTARERLRTLRETQTALREARQSGDISTGEYRARMAVTAAQIRAVQTQLDSSEAVSRDLPDAALEAHGVNREEIDRLRQDTDELHGPEVAEIARQIAGDDEDDDGRENAERTGPPENAGNGGGNVSTENRSDPAGPPDEAGSGKNGDGSEGGPGNSDEAGSGDGSDGDGSEGGPGNSDEAGRGDRSDGNGSEGGPGNGDGSDGSSGNSDGAGNSDGRGQGTR